MFRVLYRRGNFVAFSRRNISTAVNAKLWYLKPLAVYETEKPYHINLPANALLEGSQSNEESGEYPGIQVSNLRGQEDQFTLDRNGFQVFGCGASDELETTKRLNNAVSYDEYADPDIVRKKYYPAVNEFLKSVLGAGEALAFTHDVRLSECEIFGL
jgi:hypothetical protein